jgi:hypothetical protein
MQKRKSLARATGEATRPAQRGKAVRSEILETRNKKRPAPFGAGATLHREFSEFLICAVSSRKILIRATLNERRSRQLR